MRHKKSTCSEQPVCKNARQVRVRPSKAIDSFPEAREGFARILFAARHHLGSSAVAGASPERGQGAIQRIKGHFNLLGATILCFPEENVYADAFCGRGARGINLSPGWVLEKAPGFHDCLAGTCFSLGSLVMSKRVRGFRTLKEATRTMRMLHTRGSILQDPHFKTRIPLRVPFFSFPRKAPKQAPVPPKAGFMDQAPKQGVSPVSCSSFLPGACVLDLSISLERPE